MLDDNEIVQLYLERSERAIEETNVKYERYCFKIAYNILYNNQDSEECVNDTYFCAWNAIPPDNPRILSVYLGKITRNLALNLFNKNSRKKRGGGQIELVFEELEEIIYSNNNPSDYVEVQLVTQIIDNYLEKLPKIQRMIFVGRYWHMDSIEDISKHLGISESKTKTTLFRIRKGLKEHLQKEGVVV